MGLTSLKRRQDRRTPKLGEEEAFGGAGFLGGIVVRPPLLPGLGGVAERFAGDEAKRAVDPSAGIGVERVIVQEIQEIGDCCETLLVGEHAGFGDADGSALAYAGRRIMGETIEQRVDGAIGAQHGEAFDGPETSLLVTIADESEQVVEHEFWLHTTVAQSAEAPQSERTLRGIFANQLDQTSYGSGRFAEIVGGEVDFNGCTAHAKIFGFHGAQHQVEEPVGILQATAPAFGTLADEVERPLVAANGEG